MRIGGHKFTVNEFVDFAYYFCHVLVTELNEKS